MSWKQQGIDIIKRRWQLIAIVCAVTLSYFLLTYQTAKERANIQMRFIVGQIPFESAHTKEEERYYNWVSSEYVVAGISDWSNGNSFAKLVSDRLLALNYEAYKDMDVQKVSDDMYAQAARSQLLVNVYHDTEQGVKDFADAVTYVFVNQAATESGIPQLALDRPVVTPIDGEHIIQDYRPFLQAQMDLPTRLTFGLLSGFVVALLVELFDPTIRYQRGNEILGLPLMGEIPKG